jgi:hypothetical protein
MFSLARVKSLTINLLLVDFGMDSGQAFLVGACPVPKYMRNINPKKRRWEYGSCCISLSKTMYSLRNEILPRLRQGSLLLSVKRSEISDRPQLDRWRIKYGQLGPQIQDRTHSKTRKI